MFHESECDFCGDCLDRCHYLDFNKESGACGVEVAGPNLKLFPRGKNYEPFRVKNVKDAKDHGAEAMVNLCPMCFATLNKKVHDEGMKNFMISDMCRLALGEELPAEKPL